MLLYSLCAQHRAGGLQSALAQNVPAVPHACHEQCGLGRPTACSCTICQSLWNSDSSTMAGLACFALPMRGPGDSLRSAPHASGRLHLARVWRPSPVVFWPGGSGSPPQGGDPWPIRGILRPQNLACQGARITG